MSSELCYWDVRSLPDAIIFIGLLLVALTILIIILVRLKSIKRYGEHGRSIARIYVLIAFWSLLLTSQLLYSISVYFFKISDDPTLDMSDYSRTYLRIDILPGFMVQTIFLQICKLYYKGLTNTIEISKMPKWERQFINVLKTYCVIRIISQSVGVLLVNIFAQTNYVSTFLEVNIWILIADSFITNAFLMISLKIYMVRFNQSGRLEEQDLQRLKKEYVVMIFTSAIRILIDLVFLIIIPLTNILDSGSCIGPFSDHAIRTIVYNFIGNIINHVLPIIWILKIYNLSSFDNDNSSQYGSKGLLIRSILGEE